MRKAAVVLGFCALALTGCVPGEPTLDQAPIEPNTRMVSADISYWSTPSKYTTCDVATKDLVVDSQEQVWIYRLAPVCAYEGRHGVHVGAFTNSIELYGKEVDNIKRVENADTSRYTLIENIEVIGEMDKEGV